VLLDHLPHRRFTRPVKVLDFDFCVMLLLFCGCRWCGEAEAVLLDKLPHFPGDPAGQVAWF
jgi:hypothetical protein